MQLTRLVPPEVLATDGAAAAVLSAVIMRANFVPGIRFQLGWRGLQVLHHEEFAWNARIEGVRGIFGLSHEASVRQAAWSCGTFGVHYFPAPGEELVDALSIEAAVLTQKASYLSDIRTFIDRDDYLSLFRIGVVDLTFDASLDGLSISVEAPSRQRTIAGDGVVVEGGPGEQRQVLLEPGDADQDFPSYEVALRLYELLAASVTIIAGERPAALLERRAPGQEWTYDRAGHFVARSCPDVELRRLVLEFGSPPRERPSRATEDDREKPGLRVVWQRGEPLPAELAGARWWNASAMSDLKTIDKSALGVHERPELIVLTGFLGAGKTSFLQRFIEHQAQRSHFVAVIQNEIGEVGLDGKLLESDYAVKELDEGCVCCSLVGNLRRGLTDILTQFQPDFVVLETTGLANPLNLLPDLHAIEDQVKPGPTITVVDASTIARVMVDYELAQDQVRAADIVLLNKTDLLDRHAADAALAAVVALNPLARVFETQHGDLNLSRIFEADARPDRPNPGNVPQHPTHREAELEALTIAVPGMLDRSRFLEAVGALPGGVFRMKGVLHFRGEEIPCLVQYVAGRCELSPFPSLGLNDRFLLLVGRDLDKNALRLSFGSLQSS